MLFDHWVSIFDSLVVAAVGGLISIMLKQGKKDLWCVVWGVAGSAFGGQSISWLCSGLGVNPDLTLFFVSVAGWIGAEKSMEFLERQIRQRAGDSSDGNNDEVEKDNA